MLEIQQRVSGVAWGWSLFSKAKSPIYNNELALESAALSKCSYGDSSKRINDTLKKAGFEYYRSYNYKENYDAKGKVSKGSGSAAFTIGHDAIRVGDRDKVVLAVVAEGSTTLAEYYGDLMKGKKRKFLGSEVWNNVWDFYESIDSAMGDYVGSHKAISSAAKRGDLKVLVTGHSLGGAAADMYAAKITNEANKNASTWAGNLAKSDIYCYTFGAIKVLTTNKNASAGYENIHNVYNHYDSFGPSGAKSLLGASHPKAKFGHTEEFNIGKKDESPTALTENPNHDLDTYIEALEKGKVSCSEAERKAQFEVSFKANGGKGSMKNQSIKRGKTVALRANAFARSGYKFAGWNTKANGKGKAYKNKQKVSNIASGGGKVALYAQWKKIAYVKSKYVYNTATREVAYQATVGKKSFRSIASYSSGFETFDFTMTEGGETRVLASNTSGAFLTNGRYAFFSKRRSKVASAYPFDAYNNVLYRLDIETGKSKRIAGGVNIGPTICDGRFFWYGRSFDEGSGASKLYVMDLRTWKTKSVATGIGSSARMYKGRIFSQQDTMSIPIPAVYSFNRDGSGKSVIAKNIYQYGFEGSSVVYIQFDQESKAPYSFKFKLMKCSLTGKSRKTLSGWTEDVAALRATRPNAKWL